MEEFLYMKLKVTKLETSKYELEVEVSEAKWSAAREKAFKKLAKDVTVQGFRKGKAPEHLVRAKIDPVKELDACLLYTSFRLNLKKYQSKKVSPKLKRKQNNYI